MSPLDIIKKIGRSRDFIPLIFILGIVIIKVPPFLMDNFLIISLSISLIIFIISIFIKEPIKFTIFPIIISFSTLFRIALNISALRLILADGHMGEKGVGYILALLGKIIMGKYLSIWLILIGIIIIVNFIIITNVKERIVRVGVRFTIDNSPRRYCHYPSYYEESDNEKEEEKKIKKEADFYGAMDAAGILIKGEAKIFIIIILIAFIGRFLMGILRYNMPAGEALVHYGSLLIAYGFLTAISAFLMSTAIGMLFSRAVSGVTLLKIHP